MAALRFKMSAMSRDDPSLRSAPDHDDDELFDILVHIDRHAYPDRYQAIRDEYVRRHGGYVNGQPLDDYFDKARRNRPFAERSRLKKLVIYALAALSFLTLAVQAVQFVVSKSKGH
jgi:hypothetical protein